MLQHSGCSLLYTAGRGCKQVATLRVSPVAVARAIPRLRHGPGGLVFSHGRLPVYAAGRREYFTACVPLDGAPMPRSWCRVQDGQDAGMSPRSNTDDGDGKTFVEQPTRGTPSSAVAVDTRNTPGNSPCGDAQLQHTDSTCSSPALETRDTSRQLHVSSHTATPCTSAQVSGVAAGCSLAHTELCCPEIQNVLDTICRVRCATCNPLPIARRASLHS